MFGSTNSIQNINSLYIDRTFANTAGTLLKNGWSIFPQEVSGRAPGKVHRKTINWASEYKLKDYLPSENDIKTWSDHCPTLNVACVFGPASGNTFAIDIDVLDKKISRRIADMADDILGRTPLRRIGREPKIALIYRCEDLRDMPNISRYISKIDEDGNIKASENGIEIQGYGKLLTFLGVHHKTGKPFRWLHLTPLNATPEDAPLVTSNQVADFIEAVDEEFHFYRNPSHNIESVAWQWDEEVRKKTSKLLYAGGGEPWIEDSDGFVINGREAYLTRLCFMHVKDWFSEHGKPENLVEIERLKIKLIKEAAEEFYSRAKMEGRWTKNYVSNQTTIKINYLMSRIANGNLNFNRRTKDVEEISNLDDLIKDNGLIDHRGEELSFIKPLQNRHKKVRYKLEKIEKDNLELPEDRSEIEGHISNGLTEAFTSFFKDVYGDEKEINADNIKSRTHILRAPTGAGKTSRCIRTIAQDYRTYELYPVRNNAGIIEMKPSPIIMLLPTYNNIDELRDRAKVLNLDGNLNDYELKAKATEMGLISENELVTRLDELRRDALNCNLKTMVYSGKIRAGCQMKEKVMMAMEAGIGTASFCKSSTFVKPIDSNEKGYMEEKYCEYYNSCPAIEQRRRITESHVVFLPHAFMALDIPEELMNARAVIADERIHHLFLHTVDMHISTLDSMRGHVKMKKKEVNKMKDIKNDIQLEQETYIEKRMYAVSIVKKAFDDKKCPANVLFGMKEYKDDGSIIDIGNDIVDAALRICGDNLKRDAKMTPDMNLDEVKEHCMKPTGRELQEEYRLWTIIKDRMGMLARDEIRKDAIENIIKKLNSVQTEDERFKLENELAKLKSIPNEAKGDREYRIQYVIDEKNGEKKEKIRLSWRTNPNWIDKPFLLLDASSAPEVVAKIWKLNINDVIVHNIVDDIGKSLNVKTVAVVDSTYANSTMIPDILASHLERKFCNERLSKIRFALNTISTMYGFGRVVAGTSIALREVINANWPCPDNIDWCHFGAMRGLDMFKFHSAAFSIGRMEVPVRSIDGLVASLTYDDEIPEEPLDKNGNGLDYKNESIRVPMGEQRNRMRDGEHNLILPVPLYETKWARLLQSQYREEELTQFVGRLRPVYRKGRVPYWFAFSSVLPDSIIVDDVIHIDDLLNGRYMLWEALRRNNNVLYPKSIIKTCPDLFKNEKDIEKAMKSFGLFQNKDDILENLEEEEKIRSLEGFSIYEWNLENPPDGLEEDEKTGIVYVSGFLDKKIAELRIKENLLLSEIIYDDDIITLTCLHDVERTIARPRQDDTVDEKMGDRQVRKKREKQETQKLHNLLLHNDFYVEKNHAVTKIKSRKNNDTQDISEYYANESINDYWNRKENGYTINNEQDNELSIFDEEFLLSFEEK
jgi:hypothetical protein